MYCLRFIVIYVYSIACCVILMLPQQASAQVLSTTQVQVNALPVIDSVSYNCTSGIPIQVHVSNHNAGYVYSIVNTTPAIAPVADNTTGTFTGVAGITSAVFRVSNNTCYTDTLVQFDCNGAPLPLDLLDFTVRLHQQDAALLEWTATGNTQTKVRYEVERSYDGRTFQYLGTIHATAMSGRQNYRYIDEKLAKGYNFYRLKIMDEDGSMMYSQVRMVIYKKENAVVWYPNPASRFIYLELYQDEPGGTMDISVFNVVSGIERLKFNQKLVSGQNKIAVDVSTLSDGTYFMRYQLANGDKGVIQFKKITN